MFLSLSKTEVKYESSEKAFFSKFKSSPTQKAFPFDLINRALIS